MAQSHGVATKVDLIDVNLSMILYRKLQTDSNQIGIEDMSKKIETAPVPENALTIASSFDKAFSQLSDEVRELVRAKEFFKSEVSRIEQLLQFIPVERMPKEWKDGRILEVYSAEEKTHDFGKSGIRFGTGIFECQFNSGDLIVATHVRLPIKEGLRK